MMCGCDVSQLMSHNSICLVRKVLESVHDVDSSTTCYVSWKVSIVSAAKAMYSHVRNIKVSDLQGFEKWIHERYLQPKDPWFKSHRFSGWWAGDLPVPVQNPDGTVASGKIIPVIPSTVAEHLKVVSIKCYRISCSKFEGSSLSIFWDGWSDGQPQAWYS